MSQSDLAVTRADEELDRRRALKPLYNCPRCEGRGRVACARCDVDPEPGRRCIHGDPRDEDGFVGNDSCPQCLADDECDECGDVGMVPVLTCHDCFKVLCAVCYIQPDAHAACYQLLPDSRWAVRVMSAIHKETK